MTEGGVSIRQEREKDGGWCIGALFAYCSKNYEILCKTSRTLLKKDLGREQDRRNKRRIFFRLRNIHQISGLLKKQAL